MNPRPRLDAFSYTPMIGDDIVRLFLAFSVAFAITSLFFAIRYYVKVRRISKAIDTYDPTIDSFQEI